MVWLFRDYFSFLLIFHSMIFWIWNWLFQVFLALNFFKLRRILYSDVYCKMLSKTFHLNIINLSLDVLNMREWYHVSILGMHYHLLNLIVVIVLNSTVHDHWGYISTYTVLTSMAGTLFGASYPILVTFTVLLQASRLLTVTSFGMGAALLCISQCWNLRFEGMRVPLHDGSHCRFPFFIIF